MALNSNASRLYVVRETTSGTLKFPSSGAEALALQPGANFDPQIDSKQNEELRASIAQAKPIAGLERPIANFAHYFRGSGVEGVENDFTLLMESLFGSIDRFFSPMVVSSLNNKLNFTDDNGTVTATIASGTYNTPQELAAAVTTAMNAANGAQTAACSYSTVTGKFHILSTGTVLSLLWKTGANGSDNTDTHIGTLLGYSDAANDSGTAATTGYTADNATNGIERVLDAGSSVSNLVLTASAGAEFPLGTTILVKNSAGGYELRPSAGGSALNVPLGMNLLNAPAAGVALGQPITYIPVNSGHPTLSLWNYIANGGAIQAIAGGLVTNLAINVEVGELINATFDVGGTSFYFNPIQIGATNKYIDFNETGPTLRAASIAEGIYRTPVELAQAIEDAMNAVASDTITVTYNNFGANAGKFTISTSGALLELLWNTGANTANTIAAKIGFSAAADSTGATTYTSATAQVWSDALTPDLDDSDPMVAKGMEVLVGDAASYQSLCIQTMDINVGLEVEDVTCLPAVSGVDSKAPRRRTGAVNFTSVLNQHDADLFDRFLNNRDTKFLFNAGIKSGGNWIPGRCLSIYMPQAVVSGGRVSDNNGVVIFQGTITPFPDGSGNPEVYATQN